MRRRATREQMDERRGKLLDYLKSFGGRYAIATNDKIKKELGYKSIDTVKKDLEHLEVTMDIVRRISWSEDLSVMIRDITFPDKQAELTKQLNYDYLESIVVANPKSFLVRWREGYAIKSATADEYIKLVRNGLKGHSIGRNWFDTGVWMLPGSELVNVPRDITRHEKEVEKATLEDRKDDRPLAF